MTTGFIHSIKVPQLYKQVAVILSKVKEQGGSLKQLLFTDRHPNVKGKYALVHNVIIHSAQLDFIIRQTRILLDNPRLDPWLARVLITELIWGKQMLPKGSKPVETVLSYEKQAREKAKLVINEDVSVINVKQVKNPRYVRVNTLKITVEEVISSLIEEGWHFIKTKDNYNEYLETISNLHPQTFVQDIHIPELLVFNSQTEFHDYDKYKDGSVILQDKASCLPSFLLNATPGSVILDMCAAPGMKTSHLAAIIQNKGKIYAIEQHKERFKILTQMIDKLGCSCVEAINDDSLNLNSQMYSDVEYIIVDPSCSGSGMVNRIKFENEQCPPHRLVKLQSFQVFILTHALLGFSKVKRVVYSTCSINPEENEQVVDEVLTTVGDAYKLVPIKELLNSKWINYSSLEYKCKDNCLYANPNIDKTNGFFIAVFERNDNVPLPAGKHTISKKIQNVRNNEVYSNENKKIEDTNNFENKYKCRKRKRSNNQSENKLMDLQDEHNVSVDNRTCIEVAKESIKNNDVDLVSSITEEMEDNSKFEIKRKSRKRKRNKNKSEVELQYVQEQELEKVVDNRTCTDVAEESIKNNDANHVSSITEEMEDNSNFEIKRKSRKRKRNKNKSEVELKYVQEQQQLEKVVDNRTCIEVDYKAAKEGVKNNNVDLDTSITVEIEDNSNFEIKRKSRKRKKNKNESQIEVVNLREEEEKEVHARICVEVDAKIANTCVKNNDIDHVISITEEIEDNNNFEIKRKNRKRKIHKNESEIELVDLRDDEQEKVVDVRTRIEVDSTDAKECAKKNNVNRVSSITEEIENINDPKIKHKSKKKKNTTQIELVDLYEEEQGKIINNAASIENDTKTEFVKDKTVNVISTDTAVTKKKKKKKKHITLD